jgi:hypothetical protein|tara:strand:- start:131 stop:319 length:189 start_codon:yes stop_codon:yes gene_type:complete
MDETQRWLNKASERFSKDDLNFLQTMAWNISNMENFIFSKEDISDEFFSYMRAEGHYQKHLH